MSQLSKRGFFITGTDTEVGKTLIASALILKIKALTPNQTVMGFKPVVA
jgi:dethiobiotin synthetase